jgi:predicted N-acetyltransferase YhbS
MTEQITRCGIGDFEELTAFLARAFGKPTPEWFRNRLSSVYRPVEELMACNYVVRHGGRIVGCVGAFPIDWHVGGTALKMRGIGGVSTDPDCRGTGLMKLLMDRVLADVREEGWPLAWLSGQRQRYRYWGWERAGTRIVAQLGKHNIKHEPAWQQLPAVTVEPLSNDQASLQQIKPLHDARPDHCERPLDGLWHHMVQWTAAPVIARDAEGEIVAYAVVRGDQAYVDELGARDAVSGMALLRALVEKHTGVGIAVDQLPACVQRAVGDAAEFLRTDPCGNWQVFDWCVTLEALLRSRHAQSPLVPGHVVLGVQSHAGHADQVVRVEVTEAGPQCRRTTQTADLEADSSTMMRLVLGPLKPSMVMPLPGSAAILDQWCPLPATLSHQDEV